MSDHEAAGKTHMPVTVSPVRILRPGDPGFPDTAGHYVGNEPEEANRVKTTDKDCVHPGCLAHFVPTHNNQIYCEEHRSPLWTSRRFSQQKKTGALPPTKAKSSSDRKPRTVVAKSIALPPATTPAVALSLGKKTLQDLRIGDRPSAFDDQVGGDHYKTMAIQPVEFIARNGLGFCEGNVIKYVCRHSIKGGAEDLDKAIHYLQLLRETRYGKAA